MQESCRTKDKRLHLRYETAIKYAGLFISPKTLISESSRVRGDVGCQRGFKTGAEDWGLQGGRGTQTHLESVAAADVWAQHAPAKPLASRRSPHSRQRRGRYGQHPPHEPHRPLYMNPETTPHLWAPNKIRTPNKMQPSLTVTTLRLAISEPESKRPPNVPSAPGGCSSEIVNHEPREHLPTEARGTTSAHPNPEEHPPALSSRWNPSRITQGRRRPPTSATVYEQTETLTRFSLHTTANGRRLNLLRWTSSASLSTVGRWPTRVRGISREKATGSRLFRCGNMAAPWPCPTGAAILDHGRRGRRGASSAPARTGAGKVDPRVGAGGNAQVSPGWSLNKAKTARRKSLSASRLEN